MALGLLLVMLYVKHSLERSDAVVLVAVYFILLKLALIVALALLFSCFTTPLLAILFTVGLYIVGLYVQELRDLPVEVMSPAMAAFTKWLSRLLPNFENFNVMAMAAHGRAVPDRKSTRLNSSHSQISYAVFCLKKKRTFQTSFTSLSHSTRNKTMDGVVSVRNIRALNCSFNTRITHAYS